MAYSPKITGTAWAEIYKYLTEYPKIHTGDEEKTHRFVEAVFWIARSGAQWRLLPEEYGEWARLGVWYKMLYYFADSPDMECVMVDSTILKAHACAGGASKKNMVPKKIKL